MKVLSVFDGLSGGKIALERAGFIVEKYYSSEIDKYAIQISEKNYPNIIRLGDVTKHEEWNIDYSEIDLVLGGFPCQAWSVAGKQMGDKDPRGMLFWTMLDVMKKVLKANPKAYFLIENVRMKKDFEDYITYHTKEALGELDKHLINSALVSAQNRKRFYWTNIKGIEQPEDRKIFLKDILEEEVDAVDAVYDANYNSSYKSQSNSLHDVNSKSNVLCAGTHGYANGYIEYRDCTLIDVKNNESSCKQVAIADDINGHDYLKRIYSITGKSPALTTMTGGNREPKVLIGSFEYRKLTPLECERLQTLPDNYTKGVSKTQRYKMIGNGWTIDVISHILSFINKEHDYTFDDRVVLEKKLFQEDK